MKAIILSQGPFPTPEHKKVEGGGLRCWGLAKGLRANDSELEIVAAYHDSYKTEGFTDRFDDITITTWTIDTIAQLIADFDTVIVSYCMGNLSTTVAEAIRPDQQLVLDCYVPIYVEASARDTNNLEGEFRDFNVEVGHLSQVLKRGDLFLCASDTQKRFYQGVLSGLGRINPVTYGHDMIRVVPYGIYRQDPEPTETPITNLLGESADQFKKILWFGGIYPWFDLRTLVNGVKQLNDAVPAKLIIVGAKNPFNNHPDFNRPYDELMAHINADPKLKELVIVQDWVEFNKRADWYLDSDLVVVVNKFGEENELAWRTRLVDFMWADLPILTNGGDPLGEELLARNAAVRLHGLNADEIANDLKGLLQDGSQLGDIRKRLAELKQNYYWDVVTKQLAEDIKAGTHAVDLRKFGDQQVLGPQPGGTIGKARRAVGKAKMVPAYARKYGMRNTYFAVRTKVNNRLRGVNVGVRNTPGIVMVAHQLDNSGAPYVFMDLAKVLLDSNLGVPLDFHTFNPAKKDNIVLLNKWGIKPKIHISKDIEIPFIDGDSVVLNTVAHSLVLKSGIYNGLESGKLRKLSWFVHEDEPELLFMKSEAARVKKLLEADKIVIFIAAIKTVKNYQKFFGNTKNIRLQPYTFVVPEKFRRKLGPSDFDKLTFCLPGTVGDGRKGQLPLFYALAAFQEKYYRPNPDRYRDFELVYIGMTDDFLSRQIRNHADKLFGNKFVEHPIVTHERALELTQHANVTLCYSLREVLPIFVFEGLAAGHVLLRNDCSGMEEQLIPGENGYYLDSGNFGQVVETFETILNKEKTSGDQLAAMSAKSYEVGNAQANHNYDDMIREIMSGPKE